MDNGEMLMRASSFPPNWGLGILVLYFYCQQSIPSLHTIHIYLWSICSEKFYLILLI